ncbi:unnamed protein product [Clonostachys byssicola]|uniref:BTB domain-containing protein n=1 Tax=Clonostachys byssicola TaxID=160290 RepID=A0A9N9U9H0_9HYPO|nr:unnamed protein product [Clonostachys byssicola]
MELLAWLQDCEDSDCVVKCGDAEFKVHQSILREASPLLDVYLSCSSTKHKKVVSVPHNFGMYTMQALLEFMYDDNYSFEPDTKGQKDLVAACKFHITVGIAARWYEMDGEDSLDDLSRRKLKSSLPGVEADGLAQIVRSANQLAVDFKTQRMVARAVARAMQNENNKHYFKHLDMSEDFRGLVNFFFQDWLKQAAANPGSKGTLDKSTTLLPVVSGRMK